MTTEASAPPRRGDVGLIIVGDEILSGKRQDKHLAKVIELLVTRGLALSWARYVGDDRPRITQALGDAFAGGDLVFCTGGIGATPDDHTRQCAAAALGVALELHPEAKTLTIRRGTRLLSFYERLAIFAKVDGEDDAVAQMTWFRDLCNDLWRRREELTPCVERQRLVGWLDVYGLLPRLNCRECGERTCMAFACSLILGLRELEECPRLREEAYAEGGRRLAELGYGRDDIAALRAEKVI